MTSEGFKVDLSRGFGQDQPFAVCDSSSGVPESVSSESEEWSPDFCNFCEP